MKWANLEGHQQKKKNDWKECLFQEQNEGTKGDKSKESYTMEK